MNWTVISFKQARKEFEKSYAENALRVCDGNVTAAARLAEKDRRDFYELLKRNDVDPQDFRDLASTRRVSLAPKGWRYDEDSRRMIQD